MCQRHVELISTHVQVQRPWVLPDICFVLRPAQRYASRMETYRHGERFSLFKCLSSVADPLLSLFSFTNSIRTRHHTITVKSLLHSLFHMLLHCFRKISFVCVLMIDEVKFQDLFYSDLTDCLLMNSFAPSS